MIKFWENIVSRWDIAGWRSRLQTHLERPVFIPMVCAVAGVNAFIPFFPVEIFLILRVLVRPREWWRNALLTAGVSALGACCVAYLVQLYPHAPWVTWLSNHVGQETWDRVTQMIYDRGALGLFFCALSFLPLPPAIAVCALSKVPYWEIGLAIWMGNFIKYAGFSWVGAYAPLESILKSNLEKP